MVTVPSVSCQLWCPKVSKGERREAGIQWIQPPKAVSDRSFRQTTSGAHGSANRADCLPRGKPPACIDRRQLCRKKFPRWGMTRRLRRGLGLAVPRGARLLQVAIRRGLGASGKPPVLPQAQTPAPVGNDAPTPARIGTCRPMGRSHFSFGGERKVCKRKPAARRLREKALYCPFWRRGSLCRAQRSWPAMPAIVCARSSPFSAVKMGGPFSLRCLSPLCSPAVGVGQAYPLQGGWLPDGWLALQGQRPTSLRKDVGLCCEP